MSALPDAGRCLALSALIRGLGPLSLRLYTGRTQPVDAVAQTNEFIEATFTGYARIELDPGAWEAPATDGDGISAIAYPVQYLVAGGTQGLAGYILTDLKGRLILFEEVDGLGAVEGFPIAITPRLEAGAVD